MMAGFNPEAGSIVAIEEAGTNKIRIKIDRNMNGKIDADNSEEITYEYDDDNNSVDQILNESKSASDPDYNKQIYIDNVTAMTFTYLNADDEDLIVEYGSGSLSLTDSLYTNEIRTVEISITVEEPAGRSGTVNRTYSTRVLCRNMGL